MFKWMLEYLWRTALSTAGKLATRAQVTRAIRARASQLLKGFKLSYSEADAMARRALRAANTARTAMSQPDKVNVKPNQIPIRDTGDNRSRIEYRVVVTYEDPSTGERVNTQVLVSSNEVISASEAIEIAMNTADASGMRAPDSLPRQFDRGDRTLDRYVPVSGTVATISFH